jgi:hypothetical protein
LRNGSRRHGDAPAIAPDALERLRVLAQALGVFGETSTPYEVPVVAVGED